MAIGVEDLRAVTGKAVVELEDREEITASGLLVIEHRSGNGYRPNRDFEIGEVVSLGGTLHPLDDRSEWYPWDAEWWPMLVGDRVIVQARSGGEAGADIGEALGRGRGEVIVVELDEVVAILED